MNVRVGQVFELNRPDLEGWDYIIVVVGVEREDVWQCLVLYDAQDPHEAGSLATFRTKSLTNNFSEIE